MPALCVFIVASYYFALIILAFACTSLIYFLLIGIPDARLLLNIMLSLLAI